MAWVGITGMEAIDTNAVLYKIWEKSLKMCDGFNKNKLSQSTSKELKSCRPGYGLQGCHEKKEPQ